jgi:enamine deaminase RidA (YjgF/YER057c/UK114 family)
MAKTKKKVAKKVARRSSGASKDLTRIDPGPRMSDAIIHEGRVFLAGKVADRSKGRSVREQTAEVLEQIDATLKKAGTDKTRILTANIWLSDISTFSEMNAVWDAWVVPGRTPARATVEAKLAAPEYKVEIMVTAAL